MRGKLVAIAACLIASAVGTCGGLALPNSGSGWWAWIVWASGILILILIGLEALELIELPFAQGCVPSAPLPRDPPFVSIHVPISSEPPEVVSRTLAALSALRYPAFEVLVVDNNTPDDALWRPIQGLCAALGPRFRFFHLPTWPGNKAGALNFALAQTAPEAGAIAVVDADYEVSPEFLAELVPELVDESVGFVQAPQAYRSMGGQLERMMYWEYAQFFEVSMRIRQHRNSILLHGTMTVVRREALERVSGWSEWCLTEDSELGLRLLAVGYRGVYRHRALGRGLIPFTFSDYARQRQRWVAGGQQALARHWRFFLPRSPLSCGQRFHYLQGWAPWIRDAVVVGTAPLAVAAPVLDRVSGRVAPSQLWGAAVLTLFCYLAIRQLVIYRWLLQRPLGDALAAGLAIVTLIPTVGSAWLRSILGSPPAFRRTPKRAESLMQGSESTHAALAGIGGVLGAVMLALSQPVTTAALLLLASVFATSARLIKIPAPSTGSDVVRQLDGDMGTNPTSPP